MVHGVASQPDCGLRLYEGSLCLLTVSVWLPLGSLLFFRTMHTCCITFSYAEHVLLNNMFDSYMSLSEPILFVPVCGSHIPFQTGLPLCIRISCFLHSHSSLILFPQLVLIVCRIYPHFLCYLNPSLPMILCQILMNPAFTCMISRFDPFCVPLHLISDSVFCFVWTTCFWTALRIATSPFGLPFRCVERI